MSWRGLDHRTIYEMVVHGGAGPGASMDAEQQWLRMQDVITEAEHGIAAAIRTSESEWEGGGADTTRSAYTSLGAWALNAAVSAHITATGMRNQAESAMSTRMYVAENAPPQNFLEHVHDQLGSWDGHTVYDEQAAAVDRLMTDYEVASEDNSGRFDGWSVPPTIVVTPAMASPAFGAGGSMGAMPDTGGLAPSGGAGGGTSAVGAAGMAQAPSPVGAISAPGAGPAGAGVGPGAGGPGVVSGVPGAGTGPGAASGAGGGGRLAPGPAGSGVGGGGAGARGVGASGVGASGVGGGRAGGNGAVAGNGVGRAGTAGSGAVGAPGSGAGGLGTGGVARPSQRPPGSPGGSGTGPGPWSRAAAEAGRSTGGAGAGSAGGFRPVVPMAPPPTSTPGWRSVLLPPEPTVKDGATGRPPGEAAARGSATGPGGAVAASTQGTAGARPAGAVGHGMYPPMTGAGSGGQPDGRRRPSFLVDDSEAFVDKRWVCPPVITPDDPL